MTGRWQTMMLVGAGFLLTVPCGRAAHGAPSTAVPPAMDTYDFDTFFRSHRCPDLIDVAAVSTIIGRTTVHSSLDLPAMIGGDSAAGCWFQTHADSLVNDLGITYWRDRSEFRAADTVGTAWVPDLGDEAYLATNGSAAYVVVVADRLVMWVNADDVTPDQAVQIAGAIWTSTTAAIDASGGTGVLPPPTTSPVPAFDDASAAATARVFVDGLRAGGSNADEVVRRFALYPTTTPRDVFPAEPSDPTTCDGDDSFTTCYFGEPGLPETAAIGLQRSPDGIAWFVNYTGWMALGDAGIELDDESACPEFGLDEILAADDRAVEVFSPTVCAGDWVLIRYNDFRPRNDAALARISTREIVALYEDVNDPNLSFLTVDDLVSLGVDQASAEQLIAAFDA